jgi:hypothetical protein
MVFSRIRWACLLLVVGWACSDKKAPGLTPCGQEVDCQEGMGCPDGACRPKCATNEECKEGHVCDSGYCKRSCSEDKECASNERCLRGYCVLKRDADCVDADHDGYGNNCQAGTDCNDQDPLTHPGSMEVCDDGIDNDCDGRTDAADADCFCTAGQTRSCYNGPAGTLANGVCHAGVSLCGPNQLFGPCLGEKAPAAGEYPDETLCDGLDNNCNGDADENLLNRCGECFPLNDQLVELCGDGLDNNCDGVIDENCNCDPNCHCADQEHGSNCECHPPIHQPCYSGPPGTLGFGICHGGFHDCRPAGSGYAWTECVGEVLPGQECANGEADVADNDCDGATDEDCLADKDGDGYSPPEDCNDSPEMGANIHPGAPETCNSIDDNCNGIVDEGVMNACAGCGEVPAEVCGDGLDNNCNGLVDENCGGCSGSEQKACYLGQDGTQGKGSCHAGVMTCDGEFWSECQNEVHSSPEICDGVDNDCDGETDERWAIGSNACGWCNGTEICDGVDNDCDALTDEGLRNACGRCITCTRNEDCAEGATCNPETNVCEETDCDALDNDCDGLVDEELLTACGTCPQGACYVEGWDKPGQCEADLRACQGTIPDPLDPDAITLGEGMARTPFIYIAVTGNNAVAKLDTESGAVLWEKPSGGTWPSRTAVALDYSVWVGNRGFYCNGGPDNCSDPNYSNAVHMDADGNILCRVDAINTARGVAIDGEGNAWIGTYYGQKLYKVHGNDVNNIDCTRPPCCKRLGTYSVGVSIYGLAIDGNGFLWTSSSPNTVKVNTVDGSIVTTVANPWYYGIAIDRNNDVWLGGWGGSGPVHRLLGVAPYTRFDTGVNNVTAVAVATDGFIWGSSYGTNQVVKIDPVSGAVVCRGAIPALGGNLDNGSPRPHGVALDANGKVWVPSRYGGYANRFNPADCSLDKSFPVHPNLELYTYSDMTGMQLRTVTTNEGHWVQNFDSGYSAPIWHSATWQADTPPSTSVTVSFVSADSEAWLQSNHSPVCGPFSASPADLRSCVSLQGHRWLSADVRLGTSKDGVRPIFRNLQVFWSY